MPRHTHSHLSGYDTKTAASRNALFSDHPTVDIVRINDLMDAVLPVIPPATWTHLLRERLLSVFEAIPMPSTMEAGENALLSELLPRLFEHATSCLD